MASSSLPPEVTRYVEYLREAYARQPPRSVASSWIRATPGEQHIGLALVESEVEVLYVAMDSFTRSTLHGREEDIMKPKRTLLLSQVYIYISQFRQLEAYAQSCACLSERILVRVFRIDREIVSFCVISRYWCAPKKLSDKRLLQTITTL